MATIFGRPFVAELRLNNQYGSTVLKSLQNDNIPDLDLLVREAVQNCSDASLNTSGRFFSIDFKYGDFDSRQLASHMVGIESILKKRFPASKATFLEIRDSHTSGLTGPCDYNDITPEGDHGNYFKLIFDTGKRQEKRGAGGNWGFGKSVYYRISQSGLVFFYSRIKSESRYEERLVATMIENEDDPKSILSSVSKRTTGRAWWGRPGVSNNVLPVTDAGSIDAFLGIFGLKRFSGTDTGTVVIIPFIDEERLLEQVVPHEGVNEEELSRCIWKDSIPEYLKYAIQKWYAPKLTNTNLEKVGAGGKWMRATVNGDGLRAKEMPRFFQLAQELYTTALYKCEGEDYSSKLFEGIKTKDIRVRRENLKHELVGIAAFVTIARRMLDAGRAGISPYTLTRNFKSSEEVNEPIVMFAREPGMIIDFSINSEWSKGAVAPIKQDGQPEDEYVVAFFVPNASNEFLIEGRWDVNRGFAEEFIDLGGYLRACEASDHTSWQDRATSTLVHKIQSGVSKGLADATKPTSMESRDASVSRLSSRLGRALLPPLNYADKPKPRTPSKGGPPSGGSGSKKLLEVGDARYSDGALMVPVTLNMGEKSSVTIRLEVQTESGTLSPQAWAKDEIDLSFPVEIASASFVLKKKDGEQVFVSCRRESPAASSGPVSIALQGVDGGGNVYPLLQIGCEVPGQTLKGDLALQTADKTIECVVKAV